MNILYIIGNGFDMNLGLKTGYQDFYDYYIAQKSTSEAVSRLKDYLKKERYHIWADLEMGMGQYTTQVGSVKEFEDVCHDLSFSLRKYLKDVQTSFTAQPSDTHRLYEYLSTPQSGLLEGNVRALNSFLSDGSSIIINVISFNYTDTFERLSAYKGKAVNMDGIGSLRSVRHIHLSLKDTDVILGVNDESQIANKDFIVPEVFDLVVKPHINQQLGTLVDNECRSLIRDADLICLFGVSIGDTDKCWWQEIGNNMLGTKKRLVYYVYDSDAPQFNNQLIGKRRDNLMRLLQQCNLPLEDKNVLNRVFVGYRTNFFSIR